MMPWCCWFSTTKWIMRALYLFVRKCCEILGPCTVGWGKSTIFAPSLLSYTSRNLSSINIILELKRNVSWELSKESLTFLLTRTKLGSFPWIYFTLLLTVLNSQYKTRSFLSYHAGFSLSVWVIRNLYFIHMTCIRPCSVRNRGLGDGRYIVTESFI